MKLFFVPALLAASIGALAMWAWGGRGELAWISVAIGCSLAAAISATVTAYRVRRQLEGACRLVRAGRVPLDAALQGMEPLLSTLRDMQDHSLQQLRQVNQASAQLEAVLEGIQDAVLAVDREQRIVFVNRTAIRWLHLPADAIGRYVLRAVRDHRFADQIDQCLHQGTTTRIELPFGAEQRAMEVCITPQVAVASETGDRDRIDGAVIVLHDLTAMRRLESLRRDFVTNVSHELKTPLSNIKAYAETLSNGAVDDVRVRHGFLDRISEQADRLHQLILDMISLGRIESGNQSFEIVDLPLAPLVEACMAQHRLAADDRRVALFADVPPEIAVRGDEEGVRQMLDNLLDNAVKYTPAGGQVSVHCSAAASFVELRVTDTGVGIADEHHQRLFERFYRVDRARARELGGTGLGLSIVKHLAQAFGGRVGVESELGQGSTFWIRLPQASDSLAASAPADPVLARP